MQVYLKLYRDSENSYPNDHLTIDVDYPYVGLRVEGTNRELAISGDDLLIVAKALEEKRRQIIGGA